MKPNSGTYSVALTHADLSDRRPLHRWYQPKLFSRILSFSLVLFGNVAVVTLPSIPVLAAPACVSMGRGSEGESVRALQQTLNNNTPDLQPIGVDGVFGEDTETAVKGFQRANNLDPDGVVGPATCTALTASSGSTFAGGSGIVADSGNSTTNRNKDNSRPYHVVVPVRNNENLLASIRLLVSSAQPDSSRLGSFVNAGSFNNRYDAESLSNALKARGFDARVVKR